MKDWFICISFWCNDQVFLLQEEKHHLLELADVSDLQLQCAFMLHEEACDWSLKIIQKIDSFIYLFKIG